MESDVASKLEEFHKLVARSGENIVFHIFPSKILELNQLIQSSSHIDSPFHLSHASTTTDVTVYPPPSNSPTSDESPAKKRKRVANAVVDASEGGYPSDLQHARLPNLVYANKHMHTKVHESVKRECEQLAGLVDQVKLWVNLTMPKIEDGDNFGVQIQEEVLAELHRAQESAYNLRDVARQDHLTRAKICSKIIKYPHVEDYSIALKEHDEKQLYLARQHVFDVRNMYAVLTDLIHKNISKIRTPKANNSIGLY